LRSLPALAAYKKKPEPRRHEGHEVLDRRFARMAPFFVLFVPSW
jgi:hypothetical protein